MSAPKVLTLALFEELKNTDKLIIIDFWATWCPPCKVMSPIFEALSEDPDMKNIEFYECDVDKEPEVSQIFNISSIPTFPLVKFDGKNFELSKNIVDKFIGAQDGIIFKKKILEAAKKITSGDTSSEESIKD
jgi:thioredoxin 1